METLHDRSSTVFVVTLVIVTVATVSLVLRLISKWGVTRKTNADDYVIIVAWVFAVGLSVAIMIGTQVGLGAPDTSIKSQWVTPLKQCIYAFTVLYNPAIMATKTAILILYYRMAAAHMFLRYASVFTMAIVNIAGTVLTFLNIFQCRPVVAAFSDVDGTCIDIVALYLSSTPINVLTDLAILLLPLPFLTSLRMEFRQKIILVATFIVGGFVTVVDVVRIVFLQQALEEELLVSPSASITATSRPPNFTYYASFSLMWSAVEVSVGIMCCCVLVLKPLVVRVMPKLLHGAQSKQNCNGGLSEPPHFSDPLTERKSSGSLRIARLPSLSRSVSSVAPPNTTPTPSGLSNLNRTPSPVSPLSVQPVLSQILERSTNDEQGDGLDFFEMLAGEPPTSEGSGLPPAVDGATTRRRSAPRRPTVVSERRSTMQTDTSQEPTKNFFDFVQLRSTVSLTHLSAKEAWWPTMFVSILFFLWGFAYGLIGTLSVDIQNLLGYPPSHTIALHAAYWSGYFFGPLLVGYWVLTREGFKATFMAGLAIFATGALSFWPSSVLRSFPGFIVSNFIIALGLSCLEVAANPFIALAGPGELSEARLNFAQGIQGIGTIVSPIVAQIALFSGIQREDLVRVQWCYLAVALFVIFLAIVFYYVPLSEAGDDELEAMAVQRFDNAGLDVDGGRGIKAFGLRPRHLILWSGVLLMWCYDGSQESVAFFWTPIVADIKPNGLASFWGLTIGRSVFTFGRFLTSALCYVGVPPRILLGISFFGAFLTSLLALVLPEGSAALAMLILYYFFEGPIFPTQFAMMMRGQGKHTKFAAAVTMMFNSGAAVWPSVVYGILHQNPATTTRRAALLVVVILYGISTLWPVMISSNSVLRRWVDPKWSKCSGSGTVSVEHGHESPSSSHEKSLTTHLEVMPTPVGGISGD